MVVQSKRQRRTIDAACAALCAALLAGCSSGQAGLGFSSDDVASITLAVGGTRIPGAPVEVYTRVARGAKACWFNAGQPLASGYVFAADVRPDEKGGAAEITIFTTAADGRRGLKAFTVTMIKADGQVEESLIGTENARIAEPFAGQMQEDTLRWAQGETGCVSERGNWQNLPAAATDPAIPAGTTKKPAKTPAAAVAAKPAG